jgi:hypothetical protein
MPILVRVIVVAILASLGSVEAAYAYIGPGAGLSMLSAFWGLLVAVFAALGFVLFYPLRRLMRRRNGVKPKTNQAKTADQELASHEAERTAALNRT